MQLTTLGEVLKWAEYAFKQAKLHFGHGTNNPWDEAVAIALFQFQLPPDVEATIMSRLLTHEERETYQTLVMRRIEERIPVPYLTREAWFAGMKFYVDERVLIPRSPFSELILNNLEPWLNKKPVLRILDLCTGGGCIAIACAKIFQNAQVDAVDISAAALAVARKNLTMHACADRVTLLEADLFGACTGKKYDVIISNPPYVDVEDMKNLPPEYHFEPRLALEAGREGLDIVRRIIEEAPAFMAQDGLLFVEVGNSAAALKAEYEKLPFIWLEFTRGGEGLFLLRKEDWIC